MYKGFVNLYKTKGMTSSKAVAKLKHILAQDGQKPSKIGHLGTLDPDAEGVLPIAIGRATRLFDYFLDKDKEYYAEFVFGKTTDTLDASGEILATTDIVPTAEGLADIIPSLCGDIEQIPPVYSAKVVGGVRAYKLARGGKALDLKPKTVKIHTIELLDELGEDAFSFRIVCGGGTYIRSIARDMAVAAGSLGYMKYLKRLKSGPFILEDAKTLEELTEGDIKDKIVPIDDICKGMFARYDLPQELADKALNGINVEAPDSPQGYFRLFISGELIGIACQDNYGKLHIKTRLI